MAVRIYKEGEHPDGFIGCRVTVGSNLDEKIFQKKSTLRRQLEKTGS